MNEIFEIVFNISLLSFVIGSMIALGLGLTIAQIIAPFTYVRIVIRALIANFIIVPLFAFGLVLVLPVSEGVRIGIILLSLGGGAPFFQYPHQIQTQYNVQTAFVPLSAIGTVSIWPLLFPQ